MRFGDVRVQAGKVCTERAIAESCGNIIILFLLSFVVL